ncbi:OsmC family protein [Sphingobacterium sp. SRCM116780]|uniref:OsmC family protein n=1 Tax=Sphingobacterium sp. SRCM116780 TaxID=2907623 RepID=UPI001F2B722F|nr:OsmC family protein [Sphingobacterium sp. SRCM116780]UIR54999.1 OsmC family protein [Sphingobacterium sp. SRCM116780]
MAKEHHYQQKLIWTGNMGKDTLSYQDYKRDFEIKLPSKATILGSSDPAFLGDPTRHNPEDLFLSAVSSCHMLWYLHFCAVSGILVERYEDQPIGILTEEKSGAGQFTKITLHPTVWIRGSEHVTLAKELHAKANSFCFIAKSINIPVDHLPVIIVVE